MAENKQSEKTKDFVKDWLHQVKLGKDYRKKYSSESEWPDYRDWYRTKWKNARNPINVTFAYIRSMIPRVYFRSPSVMVFPLRPELAPHARVVEAIDNWLIRQGNLKYALKRAVLNAGLTGTGIIKLGYDSEFGYIEDQAVDKDKATITQHSRKDGDLIEYRTNIKPGMPWALSIRGDDIVTPYGYDDPQSFPWICHLILRPLADVKEDQKYRNTSDLKGGYVTNLTGKGPMKRPASEKEPFCLLHEIRDAKTKRMYVICEEKLLLDVEDSLQIDGLPYEFFIPNEDPEHFWGIPDVKVFEPQQRELNEIGAQSSKLRRFSILKFLHMKGALTKEALDTLLSSDIEDIGAGVELTGDVDSIQASVYPLQPHNLTTEVIRDKQETMADMRESIGFSRNQMGEMSPFHGKTATEANIVNQASEIRTDERKDLMADTVASILHKWNNYIFTHWSDQRVIEVAGFDNARHWVKYTGDQLKGDYFIRIEPDSGFPLSRAMRYQAIKEIYQMLRQDPLVDPAALIKQVLANYEFINPSASLLLQSPTGNAISPEELAQQRGGETMDLDQFLNTLKMEGGKK